MLKPNFGPVNYLMLQRKVSTKELALLTKIPYLEIQHWMKGKCKTLTDEDIRTIARTLCVPENKLLREVFGEIDFMSCRYYLHNTDECDALKQVYCKDGSVCKFWKH